jgi:hypothetical protein
MVNFLRLYLLHETDEVGRIRNVTVMQMQPHTALVWILVQVIDAVGIE